MAIAFDTSLDGTTNASFSYTCTGSNGLLIAWVRGGVGEADNKSATYNSVAMTKLGYGVQPTDRSITVFYLLGPATGAHTLAFSGGTINRTGAASYTGVRQSAQPEAGPTNTTASSGSSFTESVTVATSNSWLIGMMSCVNGTASAGANTTARVNSNSTCSVDTNGAQATGSRSMTLNSTLSDSYLGIIASFAPVTATTNSNMLMLM